MENLNNRMYFEETTGPGFYGIPQQITDKIKEHEVSTKEAIDNQTEVLEEVITEQTERMESAVTIQTITQSEDAEKTRNTLTSLFGALAKTFKNIFTKDKGELSGETFYEMVQRENDETQAYINSHTSTMKSESDDTQRIMSEIKSTMTVNAETLKNAIDANTNGDTVNMNGVISMLQQQNSKLDTIASKNEAGFNKVWDALRQ